MNSLKNNPVLKLENISFKYNTGFNISNIDFSLNASEFISIIGPNGSGKSTLLKIAAGLIKPNKGNVYLNNKLINYFTLIEKAKNLSYIPQHYIEDIPFTTEEIISMGLFPYQKYMGFLTDKELETIKIIMNKFSISHLSNRIFSTLSGGEKQKIIIASAILQSKSLLLFDEPTSNLDINHKNEIYSIIKHITLKNISILFVSHNITLAALYSDKIILLNDGKIYKFGTPFEVITQKNINNIFGEGIKLIWKKKIPIIIPEDLTYQY